MQTFFLKIKLNTTQNKLLQKQINKINQNGTD